MSVLILCTSRHSSSEAGSVNCCCNLPLNMVASVGSSKSVGFSIFGGCVSTSIVTYIYLSVK